MEREEVHLGISRTVDGHGSELIVKLTRVQAAQHGGLPGRRQLAIHKHVPVQVFAEETVRLYLVGIPGA